MREWALGAAWGWAVARGFGVGAGVIVAIGAQNAHVLRQGLLRRHLFATATTCVLCDVLLMALGIGGFGTWVASRGDLLRWVTWIGVAFLLVYGARSLWQAWKPQGLEAAEAGAERGLWATVAVTLGFTLLNPHVYLDTVFIVGGVSAQLPATMRWGYGLGAMSASFLWFYSLAYGAGWLAPLFRRPETWRVLDAGIGVLMAAIAWSLARSV